MSRARNVLKTGDDSLVIMNNENNIVDYWFIIYDVIVNSLPLQYAHP